MRRVYTLSVHTEYSTEYRVNGYRVNGSEGEPRLGGRDERERRGQIITVYRITVQRAVLYKV